MSLQVSKDHTHLLKDGKHFFWLADTCWSAFTNISDEEWDAYRPADQHPPSVGSLRHAPEPASFPPSGRHTL